ncbi:TetR/AcrR family transcriptional regulator C-terminal domain-containing protein [Brevibacterium aurantiacum]|uniref:TetR/AcrR family transcriptional regulator C-terminal domain-containing protein n=1 Tax=Brevibacterium aurantiacum TaxID=273384 RepID=UPI0016434C6D|nr:TetR/AcrR family transcriptional regulator C-terminal domain-containing protein [Brevibacterium aurantiacum]
MTLRSVASQTGMALTALQRSFGSRDRLVDAMVQHILSSPPAPSPRMGDPIATLTHLAEHEWKKYGSHPWLVTVMGRTRPPLVPATLDSVHIGIEAIRETGVDSNIALDRYLAISAYIQGMALLLHAEQQETMHSDTSLRVWWSEEVDRLDRRGFTQRHHWLADLTNQSLSDGFDVDACFRDGLDRVIAGLVPPTSQ